jgi:hypothetical protein
LIVACNEIYKPSKRKRVLGMKDITSTALRAMLILGVIAVLSACAVKLAPEYDKAIVDGLKENSKSTMVFFASVSGGTKKADYSTREKTYNELIGAFEALKIISESRPIPSNKVVEKANEYLRSRNQAEMSMVAPSSGALQEVVRQLVSMRERDQTVDMSANMIGIYKGPILISLDQAITYESFLER